MHKRLFPSYTLAELEQFAAEGVTALRDAAKVEMIKTEIAARKAGISVPKVTPQAAWK